MPLFIVYHLLIQHGADPTLCNRKEEGPLDLAAQYGRLDTVELLVKLRPDLLPKIPDSRSLLHLAAKNGHHRIVKLLLDAGCDINKTVCLFFSFYVFRLFLFSFVLVFVVCHNHISTVVSHLPLNVYFHCLLVVSLN